MSTVTENQSAEAEIRLLLDRWVSAARAAEIDQLLSYYAPDVRAFDAAAKLQFEGIGTYGEHWRECMALCPGPMMFELHNIGITAGSDVAFAHYLQRCGYIDSETGEERAAWMRGTSCFRKIDGQWRIVHEHFSAPFDMEANLALLDLKP